MKYYYGQKDPKSYVTPIVGASEFVTKRFTWQVGTEKSTNVALHFYFS